MQSYRLANRFLSIEVIPELGAKIVSMRNLVTSREWMWRPRPDAELFPNQPTDSFDASTLIGADECVPTIAPCRVAGRDLPDHGEVWSAPWTVTSATLSAEWIETNIRLPLSPLELRRSVSLTDNEILFDYLLTNLSSKPESFLWAFHPLMALETGDCIDLPPHIKSVKVGAVKGIVGPVADRWDWPAQPRKSVWIESISARTRPCTPSYSPSFRRIRRGSPPSAKDPSGWYSVSILPKFPQSASGFRAAPGTGILTWRLSQPMHPQIRFARLLRPVIP